MNSISLKTLALYSFDKNNPIHIEFYKKLKNDETITKYFTGIGVGLLSGPKETLLDSGYFVGDSDELIAYIKIGSFNKTDRAVYLKGATVEDKRKRGYFKRLALEVSDFIFLNYPYVERIMVNVSPNNDASLATIDSCGFKWLYGQLYYLDNPYIKKEKEQGRQI